MPKVIQFEGATHEFPDDFSDAEIGQALKSLGSSPSAQANRALSGTGLSVNPQTPPVPAGLQPDQDISPWKDPTQGYIGQGVRQIGRGIAGLSREGAEGKMQAASEIARGAGTAAIPVAIGAAFPAMAANPVGTAAGIGAAGVAGYGLGKTGRVAAEALGAGPGLADLTEDAGNVVGGALGFQGGNRVGSAIPGALKADPRVAVNRSLRPTPSDPNFARRIPQTLAAVKQANPGYKPAVENGELNLPAATSRAIKVTQDALTPWMTRAEGTTISGDPIVRATAEATQGMLPSESRSSEALLQRALQDYGHDFTPQQLRQRLTLLNERLDPFYSQSPNKQSSALADIPEAVLKAQRDAVADTLYRHLDPEGNGLGPRLIQSHTGDLIALRDAALRRQNAILAEQPLTPLGRIVDPIKGAIRSMLPGKATGAGIAFAEGSEGRSLPMLRRAFSAVDQPPNALPLPSGPYPSVSGPPERSPRPQRPAPPIDLSPRLLGAPKFAKGGVVAPKKKRRWYPPSMPHATTTKFPRMPQ